MKVELDLTNYVTKDNWKNATGVDTPKFAKKVDLTSLKSEVDKLDIDKIEKVPNGSKILKSKVNKLDVNKLVPVPVDLSKGSDVVKNAVVKKDVYFAKIKDIEDKIPDITNVATNTTLNAKINEFKNEIPNITNLDTNNTVATAAENKIPDHSKYITTPEFKKLTAEHFTARLKRANLATKRDIADFIKAKAFDDKLK